jgi:hypothetical protein
LSDLEVAMTYIPFNNRETLERSFQLDATVPSRQSRWLAPFKAIASVLANILTQDNHSPRVWNSVGESGETIWYVFDPITLHKAAYRTEQDARAWLETRYYQ